MVILTVFEWIIGPLPWGDSERETVMKYSPGVLKSYRRLMSCSSVKLAPGFTVRPRIGVYVASSGCLCFFFCATFPVPSRISNSKATSIPVMLLNAPPTGRSASEVLEHR